MQAARPPGDSAPGPGAYWALAYAAQAGWPILPIWPSRADGACACGIPDCGSAGKHPLGRLVPHGVKDATTDPKTIAGWWRRYPQANIGIATGARSGVVVLDVDAHHGGGAAVERLERELGPLPPGPVVRTPNGGEHRYFRHPRDGAPVPCSVGALGPGLDVRADGGYVLCPPSRVRRRDGMIGAYVWEVSPDVVPLPELPPTWLAAMRRQGVGPSRPLGPAGGPEREAIGEPGRNAFLASVAGLLRRHALSPAAICRALLAVNTAVCATPLPEDEVRKIAFGMSRYAPGWNPNRDHPSHRLGRPKPITVEVSYAIPHP